MDFWADVLRILTVKMTRPTPYGWFHLLWLAITAVTLLLLWRYGKKASPKVVRAIVFWTSVAVIVCEVYKQLVFTFEYQNGSVTADYQWYVFPFQFCSTPMYAGVLFGITRRGKLHDAFAAYLATYAVFAGVSVMAYSSDVFVETIGINIQTMLCHSSMIVIGVYLLISGYVKAEHKTIFKAMPIFIGGVVLATAMNEIAYYSGLLKTETFNMFFINRHVDPYLPVYSWVQRAIPFPFCLLFYIAGFSLAAYIVLLVAKGIRRIASKKDR